MKLLPMLRSRIAEIFNLSSAALDRNAVFLIRNRQFNAAAALGNGKLRHRRISGFKAAGIHFIFPFTVSFVIPFPAPFVTPFVTPFAVLNGYPAAVSHADMRVSDIPVIVKPILQELGDPHRIRSQHKGRGR